MNGWSKMAEMRSDSATLNKVHSGLELFHGSAAWKYLLVCWGSTKTGQRLARQRAGEV